MRNKGSLRNNNSNLNKNNVLRNFYKIYNLFKRNFYWGYTNFKYRDQKGDHETVQKYKKAIKRSIIKNTENVPVLKERLERVKKFDKQFKDEFEGKNKVAEQFCHIKLKYEPIQKDDLKNIITRFDQINPHYSGFDTSLKENFTSIMNRGDDKNHHELLTKFDALQNNKKDKTIHEFIQSLDTMVERTEKKPDEHV